MGTSVIHMEFSGVGRAWVWRYLGVMEKGGNLGFHSPFNLSKIGVS